MDRVLGNGEWGSTCSAFWSQPRRQGMHRGGRLRELT
jgi:hypothetical protein